MAERNDYIIKRYLQSKGIYEIWKDFNKARHGEPSWTPELR